MSEVKKEEQEQYHFERACEANRIGVNHVKNKRRKKARDSFKKALDLCPTHHEAAANLLLLMRHTAFSKKARFEKKMKNILSYAHEIYPNHRESPKFLAQYAYILAENEKTAEAFKHLEFVKQTSELRPTYDSEYYYAFCLLREKRNIEAQAGFKAALAIEETVEACNKLIACFAIALNPPAEFQMNESYIEEIALYTSEDSTFTYPERLLCVAEYYDEWHLSLTEKNKNQEARQKLECARIYAEKALDYLEENYFPQDYNNDLMENINEFLDMVYEQIESLDDGFEPPWSQNDLG